jgi:hypothetical protein
MKRRSVTSRIYHDVESGALIKTVACFIDDNRVLMVDVKQENSYDLTSLDV